MAAEPAPLAAAEAPQEPKTEPVAEPPPLAMPTPAWLKDLLPPAPPSPSLSPPRAEDAAGKSPAAQADSPAMGDMERLRNELEAERALVDRLREAKLKLEQRAADAESILSEQRTRRRSSVIGRLLKGDRDSE